VEVQLQSASLQEEFHARTVPRRHFQW
jgi:hypothetical protein